MLKQLRYFQSVVRTGSFSQAAEENYISQSAISQQIKALEQSLGVTLLERHNRKFVLTPAGEHFYKKSLIIVSDYDRLTAETVRIARGNDAVLRIGYLKTYGGQKFHAAVAEFSEKHPDVAVELIAGNHEDLYDALKTDKVDMVLNDQRRAFSDAYVNIVAAETSCYTEIASHNFLSQFEVITTSELKNTPCILVCSKSQQRNESEYYREIIGVESEIIFAETLEEARLMVIRNRGYTLVDGGSEGAAGDNIKRIPLYRSERKINRTYCIFRKQDNSGAYIDEFAEILKLKFA